MKITAAEKNKKNPDQLSIYIDGQFAFCMEEEDYITLQLYEAEEIEQERIDYIRNELNLRAAKRKALQFVSYKLRSEREVAVKLSDSGYEEAVVESVVNELRSMGYINDRIYAQKYVFDRSKLKPKAAKMLRYELEAKGISSEILDDVLDNVEVDDRLVAEGLVRKKFGKYNLLEEKTVKKAYSFLHHRGFDYDIIRRVIEGIQMEKQRS